MVLSLVHFIASYCIYISTPFFWPSLPLLRKPLTPHLTRFKNGAGRNYGINFGTIAGKLCYYSLTYSLAHLTLFFILDLVTTNQPTNIKQTNIYINIIEIYTLLYLQQ